MQLAEVAALTGTATNRTVALVVPGIYNLDATIQWANEYVDLVSASGQRDVFITGSNIQFTADNILVAGIDVTGTTDTFLYMGDMTARSATISAGSPPSVAPSVATPSAKISATKAPSVALSAAIPSAAISATTALSAARSAVTLLAAGSAITA